MVRMRADTDDFIADLDKADPPAALAKLEQLEARSEHIYTTTISVASSIAAPVAHAVGSALSNE